MSRPKKTRMVSAYPTIVAFVPEGLAIRGEVFMSVEKLEAIRLSDFEHLDQETAALMMGVSRHTFGRILNNARSTVAQALIIGQILKIEGGNYELRNLDGNRRHRGGRGDKNGGQDRRRQ